MKRPSDDIPYNDMRKKIKAKKKLALKESGYVYRSAFEMIMGYVPTRIRN